MGQMSKAGSTFAAVAFMLVATAQFTDANTIGNGEPLEYEADGILVHAPAVVASLVVGVPIGIVAALACVPLQPFTRLDWFSCYLNSAWAVGHPTYIAAGAPFHFVRKAFAPIQDRAEPAVLQSSPPNPCLERTGARPARFGRASWAPAAQSLYRYAAPRRWAQP